MTCKPSDSMSLQTFSAPKEDKKKKKKHIPEFINGKSLKEKFIPVYFEDTFKVVMFISSMIKNIYYNYISKEYLHKFSETSSVSPLHRNTLSN